MIKVNDILANFRSECELQGPSRTRLLELSLAGGIAYAAPMMTGEPLDGGSYYRSAVYPKAIEIVAAVNERIVIDTQSVLEVVRELWLERYAALNEPRIGLYVSNIEERLKTQAFDITSQYNRWVVRFVPVARAAFLAE